MRLSLLLCLCGILLLSCSSPESYYLLSARTPPSASSQATKKLRIGVGPVLIPDYIDRPEIVFQSSPNKFEIPSSERWAGSLKKTFTSVLATNLSRKLGRADTRSYPWAPDAALSHSVTIDVEQFHAQTGGDAVLIAAWRLYDETEKRLVNQGHVSLNRPLAADGYEAIVQAESLLLADLADVIAGKLTAR